MEDIFRELRKYLDGIDGVREKLLPLQRQTIRLCSEIIKLIHRKEVSEIPTKIQSAQAQLKEMAALIAQAPGELVKDYLQPVQQELGEAVILYYLLGKDSFPSPEECGTDLVSYAYALCDVIGELRRDALNCIRAENLDGAFKDLDYMNEIHDQLFTLDYPSGLVPGLRNKIDQARNILAKTEGDITVSANTIKLNKKLSQ